MKKLLFCFLLLSFAAFIFAQTDSELLLKKAERYSTSTRISDNEEAIRIYNKVLEMNPSNSDALIGIGRSYLNIAPFTYNKNDRIFFFDKGIDILSEVKDLYPLLTTEINLYILDGYNKNISRGYNEIYSENQILGFYDTIDEIIGSSQLRNDYNKYEESFTAIYNMLKEKKRKYRTMQLTK